MPSRYSSSELHNIKARNIHRLPPATAVHGMALYESHRDAEQERLFHDAMFDLSNLKQTKAAQHARLSSLEASIKACASHHDSDRPISLGCVNSIQQTLSTFTPSDTDPKAVVKRANWLLNEFDQEAVSTEDQVALTTILTNNHIHEAKMDLQQAIVHLRDDHITITNDLLETKYRISKLEDLVRVLTAQKNGAQDAPKMSQEIEALTRYGRTVVLKIPKGQALVPLRASRSLTPTSSKHEADSVPYSQLSDEHMTADSGDHSTLSQSACELTTQPEHAKIELLEKPLPPVPAAASFPSTVDMKAESHDNGWDTGSVKPSSAAGQANVHLNMSPWDASTLTTIPPVQIAPDTSHVDGQSAPIPRSKGKGKANKWTDPPIFQGNQNGAGEDNTKTLFSYHDGVEASTAARDTTLHSEVRKQKMAQPRNASSMRDITNQATTSKPLELSESKKSSADDASNKKAVFGEPHDDFRANHDHLLPPQFKRKTSVQPASAPGLAPTPAPAPVPAPVPVPAPTPALASTAGPGHTSATTPAPFFSGDVMKSMKKSLAPESTCNYVTSPTPKVAAATEENTVPRAPFAATTSQVAGRTNATTSFDASGLSAKPGRIARRSAVKKVDMGPPSEQPVHAQPTASMSPSQSSNQHSLDTMASTAGSTAAPQFSTASTSTAEVASPTVTYRPTMNARVASFSPSTSLVTNVERGPSLAASTRSISTASLMAQMTPEASAQFRERMSNA